MSDHRATAMLQDDVVFVAMDKGTAQELQSLLDGHVAGNVMEFGAPVFNFLRAVSSLNLPAVPLYRDESISKQRGHSVVFRKETRSWKIE